MKVKKHRVVFPDEKEKNSLVAEEIEAQELFSESLSNDEGLGSHPALPFCVPASCSYATTLVILPLPQGYVPHLFQCPFSLLLLSQLILSPLTALPLQPLPECQECWRKQRLTHIHHVNAVLIAWTAFPVVTAVTWGDCVTLEESFLLPGVA